MFSMMISQQHIIIHVIYGLAWSLAVSLTTFGAFVCMAICLSQHNPNDDASCEEIIRRGLDKLSPKQKRQFFILVVAWSICWMIVLLPVVGAPFQ